MDDIRNTAFRFLENRMKTKSQLQKHLRSKEFSEEQIDRVLSQFLEDGYINDIDYAAIYIKNSIPKGRAIWRIKRELMEHGVSENDIDLGLDRYIDETEYDPLANEYQRGKLEAKKIIGEQNPVDGKLLAKVGRKLTSLGYESETIYGIIGEFMRGKSQ